MLNVYLIERKDNLSIYDSVLSMVVVAKDGRQAKQIALSQNWGDVQKYNNGELMTFENLKATKVNLDKEQVVEVSFLYG